MINLPQAHKELLGDLGNIKDAHANDEYLFFCEQGLRYESRNDRHGHPSRLEYICSFEEFNGYEGNNNLSAKPVTVPTEINAVTALYAFAGWLTSMEKPITFSSNHWATPAADMVAEMIKLNNIGGVCDFDNIKTPSDFEYPVALDNGAVDVVPTFTQEMSEDKKLPPIGSWFIDIELSDEPVLSIAHDLPLKRVVYKRGSSLIDSEYFGAIASECKPLPTKKQKAISEILSYEHSQTFETLLSDAYDKWVGE
ncbi:MAG: hypothetical protein COA78_21255 [Blastopirellula sp.]|nr:MAG: hypothetical protein COA78_21255 [Blastopirellula sp.]